MSSPKSKRPGTSSVATKSSSFHDSKARDAYTSRFRAIGIPAVAASDSIRRSAATRAPSVHELPAILRNGFDD